MICGCVMFSTSLFCRKIAGMARELLAAIVGFVELARLDHRAHGAVEHDDALVQESL